ncbi:MAG: chemotaxis protein CheW [Methylococcaceae bacterium]
MTSKQPGSVVVPDTDGTGDHQYLIFNLGSESFAVAILQVKEIIEYGQMTEVPMMPEVVRGVINLRGAVVPVIDLAIRFWKRPTEIGRRSCIIIVELEDSGHHQLIGVVVDAVNKVTEIASADIEPTPTFGSNIRTDFIAGMGKIDERFVIILNAAKVLSLDELSVISEEMPESTITENDPSSGLE